MMAIGYIAVCFRMDVSFLSALLKHHASFVSATVRYIPPPRILRGQ